MTNWTAPAVERPQEPTNGAERESLEGWLAWHRATLLHKCAGLTGEQLSKQSVEPSNLSLLGLLRHLAEVERAWFRQRVRGLDIESLYWTEENPDDDIEVLDPASAGQAYDAFLEECRLADEAVRDRSLDDTFVRRGTTYNLRWVYIHMIEEYARHNGHADLIRERIDGETGD